MKIVVLSTVFPLYVLLPLVYSYNQLLLQRVLVNIIYILSSDLSIFIVLKMLFLAAQ